MLYLMHAQLKPRLAQEQALSAYERTRAEVLDGYSDAVALEPGKDLLREPGVGT